jgi:exopolyphosphatase/guanosine-5'-triphosphate,3'-diphosphate pyrophosphatase
MPSGSVAVIDIGSNSIKLLVATRDADGSLRERHHRTIDARISAGISRAVPRLGEDGLTRGVEAVAALLQEAAPFSPTRTVVVATSAVRDAANGAEFCALVRAKTGQSVRILTGDEEANLIGRGLTCDPQLASLRDFYVFDLGGGSLECLAFRGRAIQRARSLQLGCVRLMERFMPDPTQPFPDASAAAIATYVREELARHFHFELPPGTPAVGTGGTLTTARAVLGARDGHTLEQTDAGLAVSDLRALLAQLAPLSLPARKQVPGLPPARADVFPTALATLIAVADAGRFDRFHHSLHNLRWGLAAEMLGAA